MREGELHRRGERDRGRETTYKERETTQRGEREREELHRGEREREREGGRVETIDVRERERERGFT